MLVTAAREANIEMHLQPERELLKIVFAFDHINYARGIIVFSTCYYLKNKG